MKHDAALRRLPAHIDFFALHFKQLNASLASSFSADPLASNAAAEDMTHGI
jgi:hypothetical protein